MSTTTPADADGDSQTTTAMDKIPGWEEEIDPKLIKWEEWSLSAEEHMHALKLHRQNPKGKPMGHRDK